MSEPGANDPVYPTYPSPPATSAQPAPPVQPGPPAPPALFGGYAPPPPAGYGTTPTGTMPPAPGTPRARGWRTAVAAAVIGGVVGGVVVAVADNNNSSTSSSGLITTTQAAPAVKLDGSVSSAAAKIGPSVVTINVATQQEQDTGSGVVIRADGYILTNNHVITNAVGGVAPIVVTFKDGRTQTAKIVGTDASDDLAVIRVGLGGLTAATFGASHSLVVGQTVVAVGAPLGLSDTVTAGIVSDLGRPVTTGDSSSTGATFNAIQTDAAINPGSSGGALVDLNGNLVGINAAYATDPGSGGIQVPGQTGSSGNIGIGFAIPSDEANRIAGELMKSGKATHALMGLSVHDAAAPGSTSQPGAVVTTLVGGGPAAKAGLQKGDVVTKLDGELINGATALVAAVRSHAPGESVTVIYVRGSQTRSTSVMLGSAPS